MEQENIEYPGLNNFMMHEMAYRYLNSPMATRVNIKGNQGGGTKCCMQDMSLRLVGMHPVRERNRIEAPIRCISKCLPKNDEDEENQQYVEFKRIFPPELIKKDLTFRSNQMILRDPAGGSDRKVEFMSMKQEIDAFMSVQRQAVYQDEEIDKLKWDENQMRLLSYNGDTSLTLTPVRGLDWTYDHIWRRAKRIYRSKTIQDKFKFPAVEEMGNSTEIEIFCWATDDNPALSQNAINRIFEGLDDQKDADELAMRRYGVFRQVSGRIYKTFDEGIHRISWEKYWKADTFRNYWHFRVIDYHPTKPWYVTWVAISPFQEWFVWNEFVASHDHATTFDLRERIKEKSLIDEYDPLNRRTLVDPLAKMKQPNSGFSVFEDLQRGHDGLRMLEEADTKNEQGRMVIKQRLKNALECGVPFNNEVKTLDVDSRFGNRKPTLWFFETCKYHIEHFRNWRTINWKTEAAKAEHEAKRVMERWSDFCRNLEFLGALNPAFYSMQPGEYRGTNYFHRPKAA